MEKFKVIIKKELFFYFVIFIVLALISHSDLLSEPLVRLELLIDQENYLHPFLYTFVVYSFILLVRKILDFILGIFEK
ncbi:MAG: Unknown protein [uncultured Sulfurovum sp.]|uniref:Uncharacterized protein n=1 Tax=uncultured Sulfurovum sp. TaxID=269237 RepID=A0A6S6SI37_9BACT|nr:MAG: Unknown protein [uncultured Sulfurovum sp.]